MPLFCVRRSNAASARLVYLIGQHHPNVSAPGLPLQISNVTMAVSRCCSGTHRRFFRFSIQMAQSPREATSRRSCSYADPPCPRAGSRVRAARIDTGRATKAVRFDTPHSLHTGRAHGRGRGLEVVVSVVPAGPSSTSVADGTLGRILYPLALGGSTRSGARSVSHHFRRDARG